MALLEGHFRRGWACRMIRSDVQFRGYREWWIGKCRLTVKHRFGYFYWAFGTHGAHTLWPAEARELLSCVALRRLSCNPDNTAASPSPEPDK